MFEAVEQLLLLSAGRIVWSMPPPGGHNEQGFGGGNLISGGEKELRI